MFIYHTIPLTARHTYYHDLRAAVLLGLSFGLYSVAGVVARKVLSAPGWQIALITAAPIAGSAMCMLWGRLSVGRRKMPFVLYSGILARLPLIAVGLVKSALAFTALVAAAPFIWAVGMPAWASIMRSNYPAKSRGLITGTVRAWSLLAASLAAFIAGWMLDASSSAYIAIFPVAGLVGILGALRLSRIRVRGERHLAEETKAFKSGGTLAPLKNKRFMIFMLSFFLGGFGNIITMPVLIIFLTDELNVTFAQASIGLLIIPQMATFLTMPLWGRYLDKNNPLLLRGMTYVGFTIAFTMLYLSALFGNLYVVYAARLLTGVIYGLSGIIWTIGFMYFAPREQVPMYMGVHLCLTGIRGLAAPFLGIWLMTATVGVMPYWMAGARFVFLLATALAILAGLTMLLLVLSERRRHGYLPTTAEAELLNEGASGGRGK